MKTWREAYGETWLADGDKVAAIDSWVRRTLCRHREIDAERPIATYALRKLGSAGELFLQKMRLLEKRSSGQSK